MRLSGLAVNPGLTCGADPTEKILRSFVPQDDSPIWNSCSVFMRSFVPRDDSSVNSMRLSGLAVNPGLTCGADPTEKILRSFVPQDDRAIRMISVL